MDRRESQRFRIPSSRFAGRRRGFLGFGPRLKGPVRDLSAEGMSFVSDRPLRVGDRMKGGLFIQGFEDATPVAGVVQGVKKIQQGAGTGPAWLIGVRLTLSPARLRALEKVLGARRNGKPPAWPR